MRSVGGIKAIKMIRKYTIIAILIVGGIGCFGLAKALAQSLPPGYTLRGSAQPAEYTVTMKKFEVSQDNGTTIVTIKDTTSSFDIASANAGATVGSWFAGTQLQPGTYNWSRRTVDATFHMQGYVTYSGNTYYTSTNTVDGPHVNHVASGSFDPNSPPADYAAVDIDAGAPGGGASDLVDTDTSHPITIAVGGTTTISLTFDTNNTLMLLEDTGGTFYFMPAQPTVTFTIT